MAKLIKEKQYLEASQLYIDTVLSFETEELRTISALEDLRKIITLKGNQLFEELIQNIMKSLFEDCVVSSFESSAFPLIDCLQICQKIPDFLHVIFI